MTSKQETKVYQWTAIISICMFILTGWKYNNLKLAYQQAETEKVYYCKENCQLRNEATALNYEVAKLNDALIKEQND
jgi:cell division protein FtsB